MSARIWNVLKLEPKKHDNIFEIMISKKVGVDAIMDRIDPALLPLGTVAALDSDLDQSFLKLLASPEFSLMRSSRKNLNSSFCSGSADCAPISAPPIGTMEQGGQQFRWRQVKWRMDAESHGRGGSGRFLDDARH
jgi:hypothetical protein